VRDEDKTPTKWAFLTNHAHVLFCIAEDNEARLREIAARVGVTERAVQRIVADLTAGGYLIAEREGRRNHYRIAANQPLRHAIERHCRVSDLLDLARTAGSEDES
jgi:DNA-binding IclR family transcriptional regulator